MLRVLNFEKRLFNLVYSQSFLKKLACMCTMNEQPKMPKKCLAAFDFDCTIVNGICDDVTRDLLPKNIIPPYSNEGWILYMRHIFKLLNAHEVNEYTIKNAISEMKPVNGMFELLQRLSENPDFDVIIISDCNSYFIKIWLEHYKLNKIKKIITNPAYFNHGQLNVEMYKFQNTCGLSEKSLCKGDALEQFIEEQSKNGIVYKPVVYVGDGFNDFCPVLRLKHGDLACCREGFGCADAVSTVQKGDMVRDKIYTIQANTLFWKNGFDILGAIKDITGIHNVNVQNF